MKKLLCFIISISILLSIPITANSAEPDKKEIKAKSVALMCIDTGELLYSKNEYEHLSPASVTKIMTILLVLEALESGKINLTDKVSASANAVSKGGSQIWLEVNEVMTVEELLKAVIVASANDACTALSEYVGGTADNFVNMMNEKAKKLGLKNTNFENCTGLDDDVKNHYSCAYDLAVISCEVMKHKLVTKYTTIWLDSLRNGATELNNTNKLINTYDGITGLKTGTTSNAGFCISATAKRGNMNLVAVVLGAKTSNDRFDTAGYLLEYGFANHQIILPKIDKKKIKQVKVNNGIVKNITPSYNDKSKICVQKSDEKISYKYSIIDKTNAPVKKGDKLGKIEILSNKKCIGKIDLVSNEDVKRLELIDVFINLITKV